jgi:5'-nucleotidase
MRILVTNDDGIHSEGLICLEKALAQVGEVYTVAPAAEMSGASHSLTLSRPLRIRKQGERRWSVDGTPTDCVALALFQILKEELKPDLCVSGINYGWNLGDDVSYSGTVAGALEATIMGVPGIAFSLAARENFDFTHAANLAATVAEKAFKEGLPAGTLLNINVPPGEIRGVRVTVQGVKNARTVVHEQLDPRGRPYYWIGEQYFTAVAEEGSDYHAVEQGLVSITPLRADMTHHRALPALEHWNNLAVGAAVPR